jgi:hypothetical protein
MKNPEMELVKKWLADPKSVSAEELKRAADATNAAAADAADAANADTFAAAADAAAAAYHAAYHAAAAKDWVKEYEELTR